jgi:predicted metal-dependent phosphoesterase TrpH
MRVDLHVHTCYSPDSLTRLATIIEVTRRRGIDRIAVTDHGRVDGALRLRELAPDLAIVGEEILTSEGELLGFFLRERVPGGLSPEEAIRRVHAQGGIVGVSHPADRLRGEAMQMATLTRIQDQLDCVEVLNARCLLPGHTSRLTAWAARLGLPGTAGSDAHHALEIGRAYVEMPAFTDESDFLDKLSQAEIRGRLSPPWVHLLSTGAKLRKRLSAPSPMSSE